MPAPETVLTTVPRPTKVTVTLLPASARTLTTPPACSSSAWVAPPATPVPRVKVGATGAD